MTERGWARLAAEPGVLAWVDRARHAAQAVLDDPAMRARWLDGEGTWFVGVDALPTAPVGSIGDAPLKASWLRGLRPFPPLHPAQLSVTYPGFPKPRAGEGDAAFRYRLNRCGAHVDGITPHGPTRRRHVTEPHAWILGLPLNEADTGAAPLTVWEGSHRIIGDAIRAVLGGCGAPAAEDITQTYQQARRRCFETCARVSLTARPGEALLLHRHLLHGIAPWQPGANAEGGGRMIAYFRPMQTLLRKYRRGDSSRESSVVAGVHEQTHPAELQDQELAGLQ